MISRNSGGGFFAALNLLQLVGWTAVMVAQGAGAAGELFGGRVPFGAVCAGIGALVAVWIFVGLRGVGRINSVAMVLLFALTVALTFVVLGDIVGGSPLTNTLNVLTQKGLLPQTIAFGGLSLPMAISAIMAIEDGMDDATLVQSVIDEAREGARQVVLALDEEEDEEDL
jgi:purine-cytosine permease-like protein